MATGGGDCTITTSGTTSNDTLCISSGAYDWGTTSGYITFGDPQEEKRKEGKMRGIYTIYVVDPRKQGKVLAKIEDIIATDEEQAILKANVGAVAEKAGRDIEQVDIKAVGTGDFIRARKETRQVKIVKEED